MTIFVNAKKVKTKVLLKKLGILLSTELRSFDNLLKILPKGTLSKNSLREENNKLLIIDS